MSTAFGKIFEPVVMNFHVSCQTLLSYLPESIIQIHIINMTEAANAFTFLQGEKRLFSVGALININFALVFGTSF